MGIFEKGEIRMKLSAIGSSRGLAIFLVSSLGWLGSVANAATPAVTPSGAVSAVSTGKNQWSIVLNSTQGTVEFLAVGRPSALKVHGKANGADGTFKVESGQASGEARFQLASLDTGIETRTKHMKEKYLEVTKYPETRLKLNSFALPSGLLSGDAKSEEVPFSGVLSLHGTEKPVSGKVTLERKGNTFSVDASFSVKIADYTIPNPGYLGITMADEVQITVKFSAPIQNI